MSNLLQDIEAQIAGAKTNVAQENVGVVRERVINIGPTIKI